MKNMQCFGIERRPFYFTKNMFVNPMIHTRVNARVVFGFCS